MPPRRFAAATMVRFKCVVIGFSEANIGDSQMCWLFDVVELRMLIETIASRMGSRPNDNVQKVTGAAA
jgi:hypothetical protein